MMVGIRKRFVQLLAALAVSSPVAPIFVVAQEVDETRAQFIARMVATHGFERGELESLFDGVVVNERILESISRPAERVLEWHEYRDIFVTESRITAGATFWDEHRAELTAASDTYGVPTEILVAILGVETRFGTRMGVYGVLEALNTLAFAYPPRARFFRNELEAFLLLTREENIDAQTVLGSYAGAMGAGQFIPTSYRAFAVDANSDGRRDLWTDWEDVFGSVANYFRSHGWRADEPVVVPAMRRNDANAPQPGNSMDLNDSVGALSEAGYDFATALPESAPATVLGLEGYDGTEYWVGFHNFRVITRYNRSVMYALAVKQLADAIVSESRRAASVQPTNRSRDPA
jgi:membrane-bound lytic murein transglycosylase B